MTEPTLVDRVDADLKQAMRDRNEVAKLALRAIKTALTLARTENNNHPLSDAEAISILQKLGKRRRDTAAEYEKMGAPDRAQAELADLAIIERYTPRSLSEAEVEEIARTVIAQKGVISVRELGAVMSAVMAQVSGRADGKIVSQTVRRLLSG